MNKWEVSRATLRLARYAIPRCRLSLAHSTYYTYFLTQLLACLLPYLLTGDSLAAYTSEAAASLSTRSLEIAEQRLGLAARALLAPEGLLQAAREVAAARSGCLDADTIEPADLLAAGPKVLLLRDQAAVEVVGEFVTPEGVAAVAEMLAGWLREAQAEAGRACSTFTFCTTCGFALPCPWGC